MVPSLYYGTSSMTIESGELNTPWVLWRHVASSKNKSIIVERVTTVNEFWHLFDQTPFEVGVKYTFMRDGIEPRWEDSRHFNGAHVKINLRNYDNHHEIFLYFLLGIIGESLTVDTYDSLNITGLTYINEKNATQIRIWLSDKSRELNKSTVTSEFNKMIIGNNNVNPYQLISFDELRSKHYKKMMKNDDIIEKYMYEKYGIVIDY